MKDKGRNRFVFSDSSFILPPSAFGFSLNPKDSPMDTPIQTLPPFIPRKPMKYKPRVPAPAPFLQTLALISAFYDESVPAVFLTFDRAVDASALVASQVIVNDGSIAPGIYGGVGAAGILSPTQIAVTLERLADAPVGPVTLTATASTGLVAVDDGGTWAGVADVGLPFDG
jgi:hypothetical protein